ncbi:MAG: hypothetical protein J6T20_02865 [Treponema sp.]|nr:hypothetical protein [Treponema sp.]
MLAVKGYIDGNTVVAIDDDLQNIDGNEILIHIVEKPKSDVTRSAGSERLKALHAIQGVLKLSKPITIAQIREERLKEKYGL